MPLIGHIFDATVQDEGVPRLPGWMRKATAAAGAYGLRVEVGDELRAAAEAIAPRGLFKATIVYRPHAPTSSIVGLDVPAPLSAWRFDETSGTIAQDAMTANVDGTHGTGVTVNQTGQFLKAARYGVTSVGTDFGDHYGFDNDLPFSFSAWIKRDSATSEAVIAEKYDAVAFRGWRFRMVAGHFLVLSIEQEEAFGPTFTASGGAIPADTWTHVVMTVDGSGSSAGMALYVNGVAVAATAGGDDLTATIVHTEPLVIGPSTTDGNLFVDDAAIYDYAMTADQVALLYDSEVSAADYHTAGDHSLVWFDAEHAVSYRASDSKFVLLLGADELSSDEVAWDAEQAITVEIEHSDVRRKLTVSGATSGDGVTVGDAVAGFYFSSGLAFILGSPAATEAADLVTYDPGLVTFCELARKRLLGQFRKDEDGDLAAIMCILTEGLARAHDVAKLVQASFELETAIGNELDILGSIVGLPREGFEDARYRVFLTIQVELLLAASREDAEWTGTCENVLRIARKFIGPTANAIVLTNAPPYAYQLDVPDLVYDEAFLLVRFLKLARYACVRGIVTAVLAEDSLFGSDAVSVPDAGIWDSASVVVPGAAIFGSVLTTE